MTNTIERLEKLIAAEDRHHEMARVSDTVYSDAAHGENSSELQSLLWEAKEELLALAKLGAGVQAENEAARYFVTDSDYPVTMYMDDLDLRSISDAVNHAHDCGCDWPMVNDFSIATHGNYWRKTGDCVVWRAVPISSVVEMGRRKGQYGFTIDYEMRPPLPAPGGEDE